MNARRSRPTHEIRLHGFHLFCLLLGFALAAAGGLYHVYLKNRQIETSRVTDAMERRIEEYRLDIRTCDMRMDQLLNRFAIRKQLEATASPLRPIPVAAIEEIEESPQQPSAVAATVN